MAIRAILPREDFYSNRSDAKHGLPVMEPFTCQYCGGPYHEHDSHCPTCGRAFAAAALSHQDEATASDAHLQQLLTTARHDQQNGDLLTAIRHTREALSMQPDCSTTHALLGHLYEQQGNLAAAQHHFQAALQVPLADATSLPYPEPEIPAIAPAGQPHAAMLLVLVCCILLSGLAAIFSFYTGNPSSARRDVVVQVPTEERPPLPTNPRWTWKVPTPVPLEETPAESPAPVQPTTATAVQVTVAQSDPAPAESTPLPPAILGPSARTRVSADTTGLTLEAADQAYFRGEYDRAVVIYESVLARGEQASPRLYQDLAWCYQQLGNSQKASEHLHLAIQGYRQLLDADPANTTAQQGLTRCEAALNTLLTTRE